MYWRDAWDDRDADRRRGRFNPYLRIPAEGIRHRVHELWTAFTETLGELPLNRHRALLESLQATTGHRHGRFLGTEPVEPEDRKRRRRRKSRDRDSCCDACDCCYCGDCSCSKCGRGGGAGGKGGCADACFDCGPGDSGCCDCNPCDGCSCCPCN